MFLKTMGVLSTIQLRVWGFVLGGFVHGAFVLRGFCPRGFCPFAPCTIPVTTNRLLGASLRRAPGSDDKRELFINAYQFKNKEGNSICN